MQSENIHIDSLLVDSENPRFEPVSDSQAAIDLMVAKRGTEVYNLAKDIVVNGLNPSSLVMVIRKGNKYLPVDGNRRIVALKLLQAPDLCQDLKMAEKFHDLKLTLDSKMSSDELRALFEVGCVAFKSKEAAAHWIQLQHLGEDNGRGVLGWDRKQQHRFRARYFGEKARILELFEFADKHKLNYDNIRTSTLERLVGMPVVRNSLGIDFGNDGLVVPNVTKAVENLRRLFREMEAQKVTSRKLNDIGTAQKWVRNVIEAPAETTSDAQKLADGNASNIKAETERQTVTRKSSQKKKPLDGDWITGLLCNVYPHDNRVKRILNELRGIKKPEDKPNITAVSLRVLLELAVYHYLEDRGHIKLMVEHAKNKIIEENIKRRAKELEEKRVPTNIIPSFKEMIDYLISHDELTLNGHFTKALNQTLGRETIQRFLGDMNLYVHNPHFEPSSSDPKEIWNRLGKLLFGIILQFEDKK